MAADHPQAADGSETLEVPQILLHARGRGCRGRSGEQAGAFLGLRFHHLRPKWEFFMGWTVCEFRNRKETRTRTRESEADTGPMRAEYVSAARALMRGRGRISCAWLPARGGVRRRRRTRQREMHMPWCAAKLGAVKHVYCVLSRVPPLLGSPMLARGGPGSRGRGGRCRPWSPSQAG